MSYLGAAESLAREGAFRIPTADWDAADSTAPLHHFPPGYSIAMAIPVAAGLPAVQAARIVMSVGAGVAAGASAWVADVAAGWVAGLLAPFLLALVPAIAGVHMEVLSEPLFLALLAVMLALMLLRPCQSLLYGTAAALGAIVRYAGLSLAGAAALWAFAQGGTRAERMRRATLAVLPTVCLFGAWVLRSTLLHEPIRRVGIFPGLTENLRALAVTLGDQLAPGIDAPALRWALASLTGALLVALLMSGVRRARAEQPNSAAPRLFAALGLVAGCYAAELVAARLVADPGIPFDGRLLAPLFYLAALGAAVSLALGWLAWSRLGRAISLGATLVWAWRAAEVLRDNYAEISQHGTGYASDEWRDSAVSRWLRSEGRRYAIFTNHPMIVYAQAHRASRELPDTLTDDVVRGFRESLLAHHGVVVGFAHGYRRVVPADTLAARLGLEPLVRSPEGTVWGWRAAP